MAVTIRLTAQEIEQATRIGKLRQARARKRAAKDAHGYIGTGNAQLATHIEGAMYERALATFLGVPWGDTLDRKAPDVGDDDVRGTALDHGCLIIHETDPDDRRFWLVTGLDGTYVVRGWMLGRDAKQPKWWREDVREPAFFVPQRDLNPCHPNDA